MSQFPGLQFVVETGAGLTNSNSYVTLTYASAYATQMGQVNWTNQTDVTIQQLALIKATQAMDILYGQEYYSIPMQQGQNVVNNVPYLQALLFPCITMVINMIQVIQSGQIPDQLARGVCELAFIWLNANLVGGTFTTNPINDAVIFPQPNLLKFMRNKQMKVGGIATNVTFGRDIDAERYPGFWKIDKIMYPLLKKSSNPNYLSF